MDEKLLRELKKITDEEKRILEGAKSIEKELYMSSGENVIDAKKLLDHGKLIKLRTHTRFIHFPKHTHNYIEMVYMCHGQTHHVINDKDIFLKQGEILILNQRATQEIYPAGENDVAVNFIILPEFFDYTLKLIETENHMLRDFIIDCLRSESNNTSYLHFKVADVLPVQNLVENLIWTLVHEQSNKRSINQTTMGLLFLQLMNYMDRAETDEESGEQKLIISVLSYIEENYREGELSALAENLHYDIYWLSREIKKRTGKTYTELVQEKRLNRAAYLLAKTNLSVLDIGLAVGYENLSYFHRIFKEKFGVTPRKYRVKIREN